MAATTRRLYSPSRTTRRAQPTLRGGGAPHGAPHRAPHTLCSRTRAGWGGGPWRRHGLLRAGGGLRLAAQAIRWRWADLQPPCNIGASRRHRHRHRRSLAPLRKGPGSGSCPPREPGRPPRHSPTAAHPGKEEESVGPGPRTSTQSKQWSAQTQAQTLYLLCSAERLELWRV